MDAPFLFPCFKGQEVILVELFDIAVPFSLTKSIVLPLFFASNYKIIYTFIKMSFIFSLPY